MRSLFLATALALWGLAQSASAAPVTIAPVALSPEFQTNVHNDLGDREGAYLADEVTRRVSLALTREGAEVTANAPVTIEITIIKANPNRPTFEQMGRPPYPDFTSFSLGGAELHGVIRSADGRVLAEVTKSKYDVFMDQFVQTSATWGAANRAIDQFARDMAAAYRAHAG